MKLVLQHATYISPVSLKTDLAFESEHATYILFISPVKHGRDIHLYHLCNDVKKKNLQKKKKKNVTEKNEKKKKLAKKKFGQKKIWVKKNLD